MTEKKQKEFPETGTVSGLASSSEEKESVATGSVHVELVEEPLANLLYVCKDLLRFRTITIPHSSTVQHTPLPCLETHAHVVI